MLLQTKCGLLSGTQHGGSEYANHRADSELTPAWDTEDRVLCKVAGDYLGK